VRAVDTNVVVRLLAADDPKQAKIAREVFDAGVFLSTTVVLETEWVLRDAYDFPREAIAESLRRAAGLPGVVVEEPERVAQALDWMEAGMDFADALHVAGARGCSAFVSFDRRLARIAKGRTAVPVTLSG
jgi:predicted nucleic-acid-binding protein